MTLQLKFEHLEARYALARLARGSALPTWAHEEFGAAIVSAEGITVVCRESAVPDGVDARIGFHCVTIVGAFEIESVGVVAAAVRPLAAAGISVFVYSTLQTDYLLFQETDLERAVQALLKAGHTFS
jgi:hypothetical protein